MAQQNIYDNDDFFNNFKGIREQDINYNDMIEMPILHKMLPDLAGKNVLDIGCGMGQHAKQYSDMGAKTVLGIDISEKMLAFAKEHNSAPNITYCRMAFEDLEKLSDKFDVITSSLAFDYVKDFGALMKKIHNLLVPGGKVVFSMSHPISTAYDGVYDRYTKNERGEKLYANLHNYSIEGIRKVKWVVDDYELYHRKVTTLINEMIGAGFVIEECQEAKLPDEIPEGMYQKYLDMFGGIIHHPDFIFFRVGC